MKKVIKNLKLFGASLGLAASLAAVAPMSVYAEEEEILFEETQDEHTETEISNENPDNTKKEEATPEENRGEQVTIDADNWNKDEHPNEGNEIPDYVQTEAERKGITPPPTPTPEEPTKPEEKTEIPETKIEVTEKVVVTPQIPKTGDSRKVVLATIAGILIAASCGLGYSIYQNLQDNKFEDEFYGEEEKEERTLSKKRK